MARFALCGLTLLWLYPALAFADPKAQAPSVPYLASDHINSAPDGKSGTLSFNPKKCARDPRGMVYFALGRHVFRQPMENIFYIAQGDVEWRTGLPTPPHPSEPDGCPDHPIQGMAYTMKFSAVYRASQAISSRYADMLGVIINDGGTTINENTLFELMCKTYTGRDASVPDLIGCQKPFTCGNDIVYQAQHQLSPDGKKVTAFCMVDAECAGPKNCNAGYEIDGMGLNYFFSLNKIPITEWIGADRELRNRLTSSEVRNYPWSTKLSPSTPEILP